MSPLPPCSFVVRSLVVAHSQASRSLAPTQHPHAGRLALYNAELETKLEYPYRDAPKQIAKQQSVTVPDEEEEEEIYIANRAHLRGQLKGKTPSALAGVHHAGGCWLLVKKSEVEAVVEVVELLELPTVMAESKCQVLPLFPSKLHARSLSSFSS